MKKYILLYTIASLFIAISCIAQPSITSFLPTSGPIGTTVTINGTNFNTTPANNIVFFGAVMANVSAATTNSITVTVPIGATYQPVSVTDITTNLTAYSSQPFIITSVCGSSNITVNSFASKVDSTTGANPLGASIGDLDSDGKPDLVIVNQSDNTLSIYKNTCSIGVISFASKINFVTGLQPFCVAIGDLDGDGKLDIAVTNNSSNTVSVFKNTSSLNNISFAANADFVTGAQPQIIAIGDLDGDGKPDLAIANTSNNTVSILKNTSTIGAISFASKVDFTTGNGPYCVAICDLDGDGKSDLAVTNYSAVSFSIFKNTCTSGVISFASKVDYAIAVPPNATGIYPSSISIADLNEDGKPDLAIANAGSQHIVSIFKNTSTTGAISFAPKIDFTTGNGNYSLSISDLNLDGKPDLTVTNSNSNNVSVFNNTSTSGNISFTAKVDYATGSAPRNVKIADFDGDGKSDLAVTNYNTSNTISVLRNLIGVLTMTNANISTVCTGNTLNFPLTSNYGASYTWLANDNPNVTGESLTTMTADTLNDTLTNISTSVQTVTYNIVPTSTIGCGVGTSQILTITVNPTPLMTNINAITIVSCGNVYIPFTSNIPSSFNWSAADNLNTSGESISNQTTSNLNDVIQNYSTSAQTIIYTVFPTSTGGCGLGLAQTINVTVGPKDTIIDFTPTSGPIGTTVTIYGRNFNSTPNNNIVFFGATKAPVLAGNTTALSVTVPQGTIYKYISVTDTTTHLTKYSLKPFVVTSCGGAIDSSSFKPRISFSAGTKANFPAIADFDGDGKSDLIITNYNYPATPTISILKNASTPGNISFPLRIPINPGTSQPHGMCIEDMNGDGKPDVVYVDYGVGVIVKKNTSVFGAISFGASTYISLSPGHAEVPSIADFDQDGKPDIAVVLDYPGNGVAVTKNKSTISNISFNTPNYYSTGSNAKSLSTGDIDGDGMVDIVVTNYSSGTISILKNTSSCGIISFAPKQDLVTGISPNYIVLGDLDGDNKLDIVISTSPSRISVHKNTSTVGSISFAPKLDYNISGINNIIDIGDLDGDGKLDIASTSDFNVSTYSDNIFVLKNNSISGNISFLPSTKFGVNNSNSLNCVVMGDMDGDGKLDLVATLGSVDSVTIFRNEDCLITEISKNNDPSETINLYPNPFTSETTITFSTEQKQTTIKIIDVLGKEIKTINFTGKQLLIERGEMQSGIYFIQLTDINKNVVNKRIVVQ